MKRIVTTAIITSLLAATPAMARDNHDRSHHRHRDHTGKVVAGVVGGIVLGAIIASSSRDRRYNDGSYDYEYERPRRYERNPRVYPERYMYGNNDYQPCYEQRGVDYYGNPYYIRDCSR